MYIVCDTHFAWNMQHGILTCWYMAYKSETDHTAFYYLTTFYVHCNIIFTLASNQYSIS